MNKQAVKIESIDDYIGEFPENIQVILKELREVIKKAAPEATEKISYQMPTYYLEGNLVHFAAYKNHIGFYPTPSAMTVFEEELKQYKRAKGSVQFPITERLPFDLIRIMVLYRVDENKKKAKEKANRRF